MLKQLRQKKTMKRILWALAILIIPPFVFWGGGSALRSQGKGADCAGVVFGKKVSFEDYAKAWEAVRNQAIMMYGSSLNEVLDSLHLNEQAWDRIILIREAKKRGLKVSDAEVVNTIQNFPFFQSRGAFDKKAYELILLQVFKTDPRQFEEDMRGTLAISKLRDSIIAPVTITDDEILQEYRKENEKSKIAYCLVSPNDFKKDIKVAEADIKKYYDANTEGFRIPDQVNVEYLGFEFVNYQGEITVTDAEVEKYYNNHKDEFDPKKEFKDLKETIKSGLTQQRAKEKALQAAEKIDYILADKTASFENAAKENAIPIKETGFFQRQGPIPQIGWFPEIQNAAFRLKPGERSALLKSSSGFANGYYIIKLKELKPSYIPSFEEVKGRIENTLIEKEASRAAFRNADKAHEKILSDVKDRGLKFEEAAKNLNIPVKYSEAFARNGYIQGLGMASALGEAAFNKKDGDLPPTAETPAGICIFSVVELTPIDEEKFKKDKEEFGKKALEAKKMKILNNWYSDLVGRANLKNNIPPENT